jgi:hypothetical protein
MTFHEHDVIGKEIALVFEKHLAKVELVFGITFRTPLHDIARRLLNEIVEFKALDVEPIDKDY